MKKTFTTFLAIATIVALAVPAGADKPPGKGKPGVHVLVTAAPGWAVHAAEDVIAYTVEVVNRGSIALSEVSVTGGFQHIEVPMELTFEGGDVDSNDALDPGETWHYTGWYTVAAVDLSLAAISSIIQVRDGSESPVASVSNTVNVKPYPECGFTYVSGTGTMVVPGDPLDWRLCIWDPPTTGDWLLTGDSAATGKKSVNAQLTVRDYVPGDWCGGTNDRLRSGEQLSLTVVLPDDGLGRCPGDDYDDANPATYYLATQGLGAVTAAEQ